MILIKATIDSEKEKCINRELPNMYAHLVIYCQNETKNDKSTASYISVINVQ